MLDILVDSDDTLYDTIPRFLMAYNFATGENIKPEDVTDWDLSKLLKRPELAQEIFGSPNFFAHLPLKAGVVQMMERLNAYHNVYIVTAGRTSCLTGKDIAFRRDFPFIEDKQIFYGWNKGLYKADVLIDDRVLYHEQFQKTNPNGLSIVMDMPHNRYCSLPHRRATDLFEAMAIIGKHQVEMLGIRGGDE